MKQIWFSLSSPIW